MAIVEPTLIIKFKPCCYMCPFRDTVIDEVIFNNLSDHQRVVTKIYCKHDRVCGMYLNYTEEN